MELFVELMSTGPPEAFREAATRAVSVESERRTLSFKRGTLTDNFAPFEAHVYSVG